MNLDKDSLITRAVQENDPQIIAKGLNCSIQDIINSKIPGGSQNCASGKFDLLKSEFGCVGLECRDCPFSHDSNTAILWLSSNKTSLIEEEKDWSKVSEEELIKEANSRYPFGTKFISTYEGGSSGNINVVGTLQILLKTQCGRVVQNSNNGWVYCDEYGWAEMDSTPESVLPEYVECLKNHDTQFTKGKIYKVIPSEFSSIKVDLDDNGEPNAWHEKFFKPSTKEAFDAQNQPKSIEKWSAGSYVVFLKDFIHVKAGYIDIIKEGPQDNYIFLEKYLTMSIKRENLDEVKWFATKSEAEEFAKTLVESVKEEVEQPLKQAVHCKTQEEWDFVTEKLGNDGINWFKHPNWGNNKSFCIALEGKNQSQTLDFYINAGYQILSFQEWCESNGYKSQVCEQDLLEFPPEGKCKYDLSVNEFLKKTRKGYTQDTNNKEYLCWNLNSHWLAFSSSKPYYSLEALLKFVSKEPLIKTNSMDNFYIQCKSDEESKLCAAWALEHNLKQDAIYFFTDEWSYFNVKNGTFSANDLKGQGLAEKSLSDLGIKRSPIFKIGKWYSFNWHSSTSIVVAKIKEMTDSIIRISWRNYTWNKSDYSTSDSYNLSDLSNIKELSIDEVQQYLPDNHPDKKLNLQFEVDKWYEIQTAYRWIIKFESLKNGLLIASWKKALDDFSNDKYATEHARWVVKTDFAPIRELSIDEVQQYLPDEHPDKIKSNQEFKVGDFVVSLDQSISYEINEFCIVSKTSKTHLACENKPQGIDNQKAFKYFRHATQEEINNHLISIGQIPDYPIRDRSTDDLSNYGLPTEPPSYMYEMELKHSVSKSKLILSIDDEELPMVNIIKTNSIKQLLTI